MDALKQGLADNGLIEGKDYILDMRWAEGEYGRFPALAAEAAKQNPNVIIGTIIAAVRAAQRASVTIPIVMSTINDPVGAVLNRSRPDAASDSDVVERTTIEMPAHFRPTDVAINHRKPCPLLMQIKFLAPPGS